MSLFNGSSQERPCSTVPGAGNSGGLGDDGTDEAGLGGTQPLDPHVKERPVFVLVFRTVPFGDVPGPLVEVILSFHLEDYSGPQRNPLREIRMFHDVTIKLEPEDGIHPFKFRHGQSPRMGTVISYNRIPLGIMPHLELNGKPPDPAAIRFMDMPFSGIFRQTPDVSDLARHLVVPPDTMLR